MYSCGLKLGPASKLNQNLFFEMASERWQAWFTQYGYQLVLGVKLSSPELMPEYWSSGILEYWVFPSLQYSEAAGHRQTVMLLLDV